MEPAKKKNIAFNKKNKKITSILEYLLINKLLSFSLSL